MAEKIITKGSKSLSSKGSEILEILSTNEASNKNAVNNIDKIASIIQANFSKHIELISSIYGEENYSISQGSGSVNTHIPLENGNILDIVKGSLNPAIVKDIRYNEDLQTITVVKGSAALNVTALSIIIKIPRSEITGASIKTPYVIKDVYFIIELSPILIIRRTSLLRGILSIAEYNTRYQFSHAERFSYRPDANGNNLCYGDGTSMSVLNTKLSNEYDPDDMNLFIINIKDYLSYESTEGNPYVYVKSIAVPDYSSIRTMFDTADIEHCYNAIISTIIGLPKSLVFNSNGVAFSLDDSMWKLITSSANPKHLINYNVETGRTYDMASQSKLKELAKSFNTELSSCTYPYFRKERIKPKVIDDSDNNIENIEKRCRQDLCLSVLSKLNEKINEYWKNYFYSQSVFTP